MNVLSIIQIVLLIVVISIVIVILSENRNPFKSMSWILVLIFLPGIGIFLYFFFGEEHRKKYRIVKKLYRIFEKDYPPPERHKGNYPLEYEKLVTLLQNINDAYVSEGNKVDFYTSGEAKFEQLFRDIHNAKHHIHLLYYKVQDDNIGDEIADLLINKAKEGVEVRIIYDDVGSIKTKKRYFNNLRKEGVEVYSFLEVRVPWITQRVNYRNHKKTIIIDGTIGFIGGMNIGDCYIHGLSWGKWHDVQVRIEGNSVKDLQRDFLRDWALSNYVVENPHQYFPKIEAGHDNPMQIVTSGPTDIYNSIERGMFQAINDAKKNICIQTPYFMPTENILSALQTASLSGVEVSIILPYRSDSFTVDCSTHSYINDLLDYGIHVYLYTDGFLHTKSMVVDDFLTILGSANMDTRSFELSFETDAFIYSEETAAKAKAIFMDDLKSSQKVTKESWEKRPLSKRAMQAIMRMFTPLF